MSTGAFAVQPLSHSEASSAPKRAWLVTMLHAGLLTFLTLLNTFSSPFPDTLSTDPHSCRSTFFQCSAITHLALPHVSSALFSVGFILPTPPPTTPSRLSVARFHSVVLSGHQPPIARDSLRMPCVPPSNAMLARHLPRCFHDRYR